jgi:TonB-dependent starch-binding outer membrane protein SusC
MEKNPLLWYFKEYRLKKIVRMIKMTCLLMFLSLVSVAIPTSGQTGKINVKVENKTIFEIFRDIERSTDYGFFFKSDQMDQKKTYSIEFQNKSIEEVLIELLGNAYTWHIINNNIAIIKNDKSNPANALQPQISVSGKVTDSTGEPLPGVTVMVKRSTNGTITNNAGNYLLTSLPENATLVFSFVGMRTVEVLVGTQTLINISMQEESFGIDEVVAIGYGTTRKKDVTGALSVVTAKDFESRSTTQFGDALVGKIAGVQISKPSGQPQSGYNIRIRGISTITAGSEPLYIVDGVPTTSITEIEPTDIESISILKDASSAAIYGASGSNGVVLITTKRGKNQETKVTFNAYTAVSNVWNKLDVLDAAQYKDLMSEMGKSADWSLYPHNSNWQDEVFRTARTNNAQLSFTGGTDKTSFYLSGTYINQEGVVITNSLERINFRVNLDHKVNDFLKVGTSVSYNKVNDISVGEGGRWSTANAVITGAPVNNIFNEDGTFTINPFIADLENPVALLLQDEHILKNYRFNGNVYAEIAIAKDLTVRSMFGLEERNGYYNSWIDPIRGRWGRTNQGLATYNNNLSTYWISENTINYLKAFGDHQLGLMTGFIASRRDSHGSSIDAKGFGSPSVRTVNAGSTRNAGYWETAKSNAAFLGRVNYNYKDKYLVTANFRADASSVFGANNKWGYFPSFSAGWRISEEGFFDKGSILSDLKLRAGWGVVGNDQIGDYSSFGLVSPGSFYVFGGKKVPGTSITSMENADLKWEQTDQLNIGADIALLNNRITITSDYYIKNTTNMLLNSPIPASVGMGFARSFATKNIGSMTNKGFELLISSKNLVNRLKWTSDFNISFNRSNITNLDRGVPIKTGYIAFRGNVGIAQEGQPLGMFFGYLAEGVDPQTGKMIYADLDSNGKLSDGDQTIIGNANPDFTYGFNNNLSFGNFTFSFLFQGVQGNDIFNASRIETEGMYLHINQLATVADRWKKPGDITHIPRSSGDGSDFNSLLSSRFIEDGSYLRLKSTTLGYNLPKTLSGKLKAEKLYIYVTGENLLTFTKYSGFDPEVNIYGRSTDNSLKNIAPGVDYGVYPQARTILFGLNVTF